ncbi:serine kinase protein [Teratosphaeria destructans]|uniref:Serine kinase protein n=1 Tax=Teratosphaeria destructans TaxID=418781 RepID=A0A9W7VZD0_9PEZI|nr:serine kinase protein [Teratosphaeria destructans]
MVTTFIAAYIAASAGTTALAQKQQPLLQDHSEHRSYMLNFSSPSPLIFHSTFGLLQQWPNTFFTNGHTIAPCTIAKNTNLYHARGDGSPPPSPEWFAFDPAMSYFIAGAMPDSHMLTYRTTRDVPCIYFDGTSASLMPDGSMYSQMLLLHNSSASFADQPAFSPPPGSGNGSHDRPRWNPLEAEYDRATGLCDYVREKGLGGLGWGYEGIVRMNAGFEVIWCNFSSPSAKLVSWLNTSAPPLDGADTSRRPWVASSNRHGDPDPDPYHDPYAPARPPRAPSHGGGPAQWPGINSPFRSYSYYDWFHIATQRYGFVGGVPGRGEARARLDSCHLFTFYDPALLDQEHARVAQEAQLYNLTNGHWSPGSDDVDRREALKKLGRRRRDQMPRNISVEDGHVMAGAVEARLRAALHPQSSPCTGIDWTLATQEILTFYASPLQHLSLLTSTEGLGARNSSETRIAIAQARSVLHALWLPFYEYPISLERPELDLDPRTAEARAALHRCQTQSELFDPEHLSASETVTYGALAEVLTALCSTLLPIFLETERLWLTNFNNVSADLPPMGAPVMRTAIAVLQRQHEALGGLVAWLGWADQWTACTPGCGLGETCYIPIWPTMGVAGPGGYRRGRRDAHQTDDDDPAYYPPRRGGGGPGRSREDLNELLWEPTCVKAEHYPPT